MPYDNGTSVAGAGRTTLQGVLQAAIPPGLAPNGQLNNGLIRTGFSAAGAHRNNSGPNCAGRPRIASAFPELYDYLVP